jgi:hypothetical protein
LSRLRKEGDSLWTKSDIAGTDSMMIWVAD